MYMKINLVSVKVVNIYFCIIVYNNELFLLLRWRGNNSVKGFYVNEFYRYCKSIE